MLGITLQETQIYRDAKEEGRQEGRQEGREQREAEMLAVTVPVLLKTGMTLEQIAQQLKVEVEAVRRVV